MNNFSLLIVNFFFRKIGHCFFLKKSKFNPKKSFRKGFNRFHPYHILMPSYWPFLLSLGFLTVTLGAVLFFHFNLKFLLIFGFGQIVTVSFLWWVDVVYEIVEHTSAIRKSLKIGMVLFIVSEVMFFFSFFWAFFHVSLVPAVALGCSWPPVGLVNLVIDPMLLPLFNTLLLISSGITLTGAHNFLDLSFYMLKKNLYFLFLEFTFCKNNELNLSYFYSFISRLKFIINLHSCLKKEVFIYFFSTLLLAFFFTACQAYEYVESLFFISDSVYGSTFFLLTGFHGFHVLIGTIFICVCFLRLIEGHFDDGHYIGLECAIWYWHFVDVVWLFLYIFLYVWGNTRRFGGFFVFTFEHTNLDFSENYQINFQDSASPLMENIIELHHYIFFYLCLILGFVLWLLIVILCSCHWRKDFCWFNNDNLHNLFGCIDRNKTTWYFVKDETQYLVLPDVNILYGTITLCPFYQ